jgi:adenosine deaminase
LFEKKITLEICPYSNYLTQAFKTYAEHPLRQLFEAGIRVTINSDDPGIFASNLSDDLWLAHTYQNFSLTDLKRCQAVAFENSFIPLAERLKVWDSSTPNLTNP